MGTGLGHGQSGRTCASLGSDYLGAAVLDTVGQGFDLFLSELVLDGGGGLGEDREDGSASVAADDGDVELAGVNACGKKKRNTSIKRQYSRSILYK